IRVHQIVFSNSKELESGIDAAMRDGIRCIVGGGVCRNIVTARGGTGIVVMPSLDEVQRALSAARALAAARRAQHTVEATAPAVPPDTIVILDRAGIVRFLNGTGDGPIGASLRAALDRPLPADMQALGLTNVLRSGRPERD